MLILTHAAPSFSTAETRIQGLRHGLSSGAENNNRCILLCSVGYIYVAQIPFSGFGGRKRCDQHG